MATGSRARRIRGYPGDSSSDEEDVQYGPFANAESGTAHAPHATPDSPDGPRPWAEHEAEIATIERFLSAAHAAENARIAEAQNGLDEALQHRNDRIRAEAEANGRFDANDLVVARLQAVRAEDAMLLQHAMRTTDYEVPRLVRDDDTGHIHGNDEQEAPREVQALPDPDGFCQPTEELRLGTCAVCQEDDAPRSVVFGACGHVSTCVKCTFELVKRCGGEPSYGGNGIAKCPVCRITSMPIQLRVA